ncbi:nuclear transport factor 2 family protein [Agarilytica rhodophyticola]|uniref:nuclear transport factor 2 family protein n=1 Tax=Agarilytica rhodophyticola TaxID=1737490 RepID=UPI001C1F8A10|nr:nuclear transport factor 2 family protein [Agarilytica rhodophyticola]
MSLTMTTKDLSALFDAFNLHDIDAVMSFFNDNAIFYTVAGDDVFGNKIEGKSAIADAFSAVWTAMSDAQWAHHSHLVSGDRAVSEWTFMGTDKSGMRVEAQGADLFTLKNGKIAVKQAFRKTRPAFQV